MVPATRPESNVNDLYILRTAVKITVTCALVHCTDLSLVNVNI